MRHCFAWAALLRVSHMGGAPDQDAAAAPTKTFFYGSRGRKPRYRPHIGIITYLRVLPNSAKRDLSYIGYVTSLHSSYSGVFLFPFGGWTTTRRQQQLPRGDQELFNVQGHRFGRSEPRYSTWSMFGLQFYFRNWRRNCLVSCSFFLERFRPVSPGY